MIVRSGEGGFRRRALVNAPALWPPSIRRADICVEVWKPGGMEALAFLPPFIHASMQNEAVEFGRSSSAAVGRKTAPASGRPAKYCGTDIDIAHRAGRSLRSPI